MTVPSSANPLPATPQRSTDALASARIDPRHLPSNAHFHVVPFRRAKNGAIVPGEAVEVTNGDIAWRWARAAAREQDNVGAVALIVSDPAPTGETADDILLTSFGEVNLEALRH